MSSSCYLVGTLVDEMSKGGLQVPEVAVLESSYASAVSFASLVGGRGDVALLGLFRGLGGPPMIW